MTNTKTGYAPIQGGKLYYESAGEGETMVLVHAGFVDSGMWDDQWDAFAQHYHVVRYDALGYGKSDKATGPVSRPDDLRQLLDALNIERAILIGCSMGGTNIIDFALVNPTRVSTLIPVSATPSGFQLQGDPPRYVMEMMQASQEGDLERASDLQIRIWVDGMYREPEQVDAKVRQHAARMNQIYVKNGTWAVADLQPLNPLDPPAAGRLHELYMPTLAIVGALDHPELLRAADVIQEAIPGAQKVVIADAAHVPNMEKPAEFNQAVLDFLHSLKSL